MTAADPGVPGSSARRRRVLIVGAGGRDFHNFNIVYRDDPGAEVVAFTAAQIPGIDRRRYPPTLAGPLYPDGIPVAPEAELATLITGHEVDEVVLAYSDLAYAEVMHKAAITLAAGASFTLLGPAATMVASTRPVVAVCAVRTGCGKSQTSRAVGRILLDAGLRVALVRHPMPYGDLTAMRVQRFATMADIDASRPTVEEREEYETPVQAGMIVYAGVDYEAILRRAEAEADVIVWDGGNNDFSFFRPDLLITVTDPLRAGDELAYHPGEVNLRMADVVVVNKTDSASPEAVGRVVANTEATNPSAAVILAVSPVTLGSGPSLAGRRVLVVEDGPTVTHGGMPFGAGTVAARQAGARQLVDPRPYAVGSLVDTFARYPHLNAVLPAMGYSPPQLEDLARTIAAVPCDAVVTGTPIDLGRLIDIVQPVRRATYALREIAGPDGPDGRPTLASVLAPLIERCRAEARNGR
jgi:predicted GTPase